MMQTQYKLNSAANQNNSFSNSTSNDYQSIPKLSISLENQQYTLPINRNSTIQKLAVELTIMIYDELLQQDLSQDSKQVHSKICELLLHSLHSLIQQESNYKVKYLLTQIVKNYQIQNLNSSQLQLVQRNKYFSKNYINTLSDTESDSKQIQRFLLNQASRTNFKLYDKAQKSIQKKRTLQKQNAQQKSKVQISYCTFHPNISKSQQKFKSKENSNVFDRLYTKADEIKMKNFFKKREIENEQQKINLSFKYIPEINECSKQIIKLKQKQNGEDSFLCEQLDKSDVSFQTSQNSSQKYLKQHSSRKVFEKLYNLSFYENRMNKTLQKVNLDKYKDKENQYSFHPQLSAGTKRMTKNYPKLQNRMKVYELRKNQSNQGVTLNYSKSKQKNTNKITTKIQLFNPLQKQIMQQKHKKGIRKMFDRIKTQPYQQFQNSYRNIQSRTAVIDKFNSQIFRVDSEFIDDESSFKITPKKLNLQPHDHKSFFKKNVIKGDNVQSSHNHRQIQVQQHFPNNMKQLQNKVQIFSKIFAYLSKNGNDITAKNIISNHQIHLQIKEIFTPLTQQLSEMNTELDKEEFIWSLQNLYQQLELQMKAVLLSWGLKLFKFKLSNSNTLSNLKHVKTEGSVFELME